MPAYSWSLCVVVALLSACGAPHSAEDSRDTGPERASAVIGPAGGAIKLIRGNAKGASIVIPPGALASSVTIIMQHKRAPTDWPKNLQPAGPYIDFGPDGLVFLKPVTITLPGNGAGNTVFQRSSRGQWSAVPNARKTSTGAMVATITHFSGDMTFLAPDNSVCPHFTLPLSVATPNPEWMHRYPRPISLDPSDPEQIDYKEKDPNSDLAPIVSLIEANDPMNILIHPSKIAGQIFPDLGHGVLHSPQIAQSLSPGYEIKKAEIGAVFEGAWFEDNSLLSSNVYKYPPPAGYNRPGYWIFLVRSIATAFLIEITYPTGTTRQSSALVLTSAHRLKESYYKYMMAATHGRPKDRRFAVAFGDLPATDHFAQRNNKESYYYIDAPENQSDRPIMRSRNNKSKTKTVVPRYYRVYRVKSWRTLGDGTKDDWPADINYENLGNQENIITNDLAEMILDDVVRDPYVKDVADQPYTTLNAPNATHLADQYPDGWFSERSSANIPYLKGLRIPTSETDMKDVDQWKIPPSGQEYICTAAFGFGEKAPGQPLRPPDLEHLWDDGPPTADWVRWADVNIFPGPFLINAVPMEIENLWSGLSPHLFLPGDEGGPLQAWVASKGYAMMVGLHIDGDSTLTDFGGDVGKRAITRFVKLDWRRAAVRTFLTKAFDDERTAFPLAP